MAKHNIGCIGMGAIMRYLHIPAIQKSPDLELYALCSRDEDLLQLMARTYGIDMSRCFTDYHDLLQCEGVDAVDIATTNDMHFPVAMAAIQAGKPFLLEKPVALNVDEAQILAQTAREKQIQNMVCFTFRFRPATRYMRDLVIGGQLGQIYHISIQYLHSWCLPSRNACMAWRHERNKAGSGCLGDVGSHMLDLVRFITGEEYTNVVGHKGILVQHRPYTDGTMGTVDTDDYCNFQIALKSGGTACFQSTRLAYGREDYMRMEIYGSQGALVYHFNAPGIKGDELEVCIGDVYDRSCAFTKLTVPSRYNADQLQAFADILNGCGDGLSATLDDGLLSQISIDRILLSCETGKWESII